MANFDILDNKETLSTVEMIRSCLATAWFKPNTSIGIVVPQFVFAKHLANSLWEEDATVPSWIKSGMAHKTFGQTTFDNGSRIKLIHSTMGIKGVSVNLLYVHRDVNIDDEWMYAFMPALSSGHLIKFFQ